MLQGLLDGLTKGGSGNILLLVLMFLLFSGSFGEHRDKGRYGDGKGFDNDILLILLVLFLLEDFF